MKSNLLFKRLMIILVIGASIVITACKHEPVIPELPAISFSHDVMPIIVANCQSSGCHGQINPEEFQLLSYSDFFHEELIVPYNANQSELYRAITTTTGEDAMPRPPQNPLSEAQIRIIYLWIMQGAKDN